MIEESNKSNYDEENNSTDFQKGNDYEINVDNLIVREEPSISSKKVSKENLTEDGRNNSNDEGQLKKGTKITCKDVEEDDDKNIWLKTPSGWVCAYNSEDDENYIK